MSVEEVRAQGSKVRVEVYEEDPFEGSCCGPNRISEESAEELRRSLIERSEILTKLLEKFHGMIELCREVVSTRRGLMNYPEHVRTALSERGRDSLPLIFVEGKLVSAGSFPSYEELLALLVHHLEGTATGRR